MKLSPDQLLKWQLARERFQIEEFLPPHKLHPEKQIGEILAGILKADEKETRTLPEAIRDRWPVIAGEQLAKHTYPAYLKNGFLYLQADHPGWLAELRRLPKAQLLKKLSTIPGVPEIKDIRFQLDPALRKRPT